MKMREYNAPYTNVPIVSFHNLILISFLFFFLLAEGDLGDLATWPTISYIIVLIFHYFFIFLHTQLVVYTRLYYIY